MNRPHLSVKAELDKLDKTVSRFWRRRPMLAPALTLLTLAAWAGLHGDGMLPAAVAVIGGIAYGAGLTLGMAAAVTSAVLLWFDPFFARAGAAGHLGDCLVQLLALVLAAWMAHHHRIVRDTARQMERLGSRLPVRRPHVLPWAVANDIRTSLAAVRFLLFPAQMQTDDQALARATRELERLEALFDAWDPERRNRPSRGVTAQAVDDKPSEVQDTPSSVRP